MGVRLVVGGFFFFFFWWPTNRQNGETAGQCTGLAQAVYGEACTYINRPAHSAEEVQGRRPSGATEREERKKIIMIFQAPVLLPSGASRFTFLTFRSPSPFLFSFFVFFLLFFLLFSFFLLFLLFFLFSLGVGWLAGSWLWTRSCSSRLWPRPAARRRGAQGSTKSTHTTSRPWRPQCWPSFADDGGGDDG